MSRNISDQSESFICPFYLGLFFVTKETQLKLIMIFQETLLDSDIALSTQLLNLSNLRTHI